MARLHEGSGQRREEVAALFQRPAGANRWLNRIVGYGEEDPAQLLANPRNFRIHPKFQQDALEGALNEIGWIDEITVNRRTGFVLDGHARAALAITHGEARVPVKYVDLSEDEELLALGSKDAISALAAVDADVFGQLLAEIHTGDAALQALMAQVASAAGCIFESGDPFADMVQDGSFSAPRQDFKIEVLARNVSERDRIVTALRAVEAEPKVTVVKGKH
jgi:hypothetical protein